MRIFDLHTHVLPGVDDGARSLEDALQMLRNAAASDVTHLVVTPHYGRPGDALRTVTELQRGFLQLQEAAREIPVTLYFGAEVHLTRQLSENPLPTLNGSRYLLAELPRDIDFLDAEHLLNNLLTRGYIPVIAHPERYDCVCRDPGRVERWLELGCHLQLTAGSVLGKFGKAPMMAARCLLQRDLAACIASDAHGPEVRTNYLSDMYNHLQLYFSAGYAQILLWENPRRICSGEPLTEV